MKIAYRPMEPADRTFVVGSWLSSFRRSPTSGMIRMSRWSAVMVPEIEAIIDQPHTRVTVVADPTVVDHVADLVGHIVWEPGLVPLVFYAYVKQDYRGHGFLRGLLRAAAIDVAKPFNYTCHTRAVDSMLDAGKVPPHVRWRPLLARTTEREHDREEREAARATR